MIHHNIKMSHVGRVSKIGRHINLDTKIEKSA